MLTPGCSRPHARARAGKRWAVRGAGAPAGAGLCTFCLPLSRVPGMGGPFPLSVAGKTPARSLRNWPRVSQLLSWGGGLNTKGGVPETTGSSEGGITGPPSPPARGGSSTTGCWGLWREPGRVSVLSLNKQPEVMCGLLHSLEFPELLLLGGERKEQGWLVPSSDRLLRGCEWWFHLCPCRC